MKKVVEAEAEASTLSETLKRAIVVHDILCAKCRVFQYEKQKINDDVGSTSSGNDKCLSQLKTDDPTFKPRLKPAADKSGIEKLEVQILRTISTHKCCCLCFAIKNLSVIPEEY